MTMKNSSLPIFVASSFPDAIEDATLSFKSTVSRKQLEITLAFPGFRRRCFRRRWEIQVGAPSTQNWLSSGLDSITPPLSSFRFPVFLMKTLRSSSSM
ncbi:hypothetical protein SDJN02_24688, partial [Cucurbita argyrosperma subsp. argyrosperma]